MRGAAHACPAADAHRQGASRVQRRFRDAGAALAQRQADQRRRQVRSPWLLRK